LPGDQIADGNFCVARSFRVETRCDECLQLFVKREKINPRTPEEDLKDFWLFEFRRNVQGSLLTSLKSNIDVQIRKCDEIPDDLDPAVLDGLKEWRTSDGLRVQIDVRLLSQKLYHLKRALPARPEAASFLETER
jgi:hypothetical protein